MSQVINESENRSLSQGNIVDPKERSYMQRAIELARLGGGHTNPNPNVGAVIVKDGRIIGEGYHRKCGELHAERNAIASLKESAEGATIYVTLEPCCHYGKTPPCTEAILEQKIAKVVIGSRDPNPLVAGKGAKLLREKGVEVVEDFMREECDALNAIFFHYISTKRPYVAMKYAMTMDGKIATRTGASKWITGEKAREHVHMLRSRYNSIMAGIGTVLADDPMLNARTENAHQPLRIVLDTNLRIPLNCNLVKTAKEYETMVVCGDEILAKEALRSKKELLSEAGVNVLPMPVKEGHIDMAALMAYLGDAKVDSILVEGGGEIHEAALKAGIVNTAYVYMAPKVFGGRDAKSPVEGDGVELPSQGAQFKLIESQVLGEDIMLHYVLTRAMEG